jgi:hypothetical protein
MFQPNQASTGFLMKRLLRSDAALYIETTEMQRSIEIVKLAGGRAA